TAIGAICTVLPLAGLLRVTGSMSYTVTATGPTGTEVGGIPAIFIPTTLGVEAFACGAVTPQLQTTCTGHFAGNGIQLGGVRRRLPERARRPPRPPARRRPRQPAPRRAPSLPRLPSRLPPR